MLIIIIAESEPCLMLVMSTLRLLNLIEVALVASLMPRVAPASLLINDPSIVEFSTTIVASFPTVSANPIYGPFELSFS